MLPITQEAPSVIQESITVLIGPLDESNEETSCNTEDNNDDEVEEEYEMRF